MAVRLQSLGLPVGMLAMLDAYPSDRWRSQPEPEADAALRALLLIAGQDPAALGDEPLTRHTVIAFLRRHRHPLGELSDAALAGVIRVVEGNNALVRRHVHQPFRGPLVYFRAALDHRDDGLDPGQWRPYVSGPIETHDIPAVHAHLTGPAAVALIAPVLGRALREQEES
jgi:enterobactin synthetase component F